jgi:hypothetical protein
MSYIGQPLNSTNIVGPVAKTTQTATANQNVFSGLTYQVGFIEVYQNGVYLLPEDYSASTGSSVTLTIGATAGDELTFVAGLPVSTGTVVNATTLNGLSSDQIGTKLGRMYFAANQ